VGITNGTENFSPGHKQAAIHFPPDIFGVNRFPKAGPACAGVVFRLGFEQGRTTANTAIGSRFFVVPVASRKGALSSFFAGDLKLLWGQLGLPFCIGFFNFVGHTQLFTAIIPAIQYFHSSSGFQVS
jgi:hypothetical protein